VNLRQIVVVLRGACVSFACLPALVAPHPEWVALERTYYLPGGSLSAAPLELLSLRVLFGTVLLTIAGAIALMDKRQESIPTHRLRAL